MTDLLKRVFSRLTTAVLLVLLVAVCFGLIACGNSQEAPIPTASATPSGGGDGENYIHRNLATGETGINEYSSSRPGQSTVLERGYPGAPPLIPHTIPELAITKDQNLCLTCHGQGLSFGPGHTATKIPDSHYVDLLTGTQSPDLQPMRYNCQICHVPQSGKPYPLESMDSANNGGG